MDTKPRLLDLFCGAGGAAYGYHLAGFAVEGVDIAYQSHYPYRFWWWDALRFLKEHGHRFDVIHASPPCQAHTALRHAPGARAHRDWIDETRSALIASGKPYVIENVPGAPLRDPVTLCGTMFGLGIEGAELRRHRLFESNLTLAAPGPCRHGEESRVIGVYGSHVRNRTRGEFDNFTVSEGLAAMGVSWMTMLELSQAIPPAYTEHLGRIILKQIG